MAEVWGAIEGFIGAILNGIYEFIPSYGLAIVLLTVLVRIVLIPLTVKQIRSMSAMSKLQPELKRLQQKYKTDRQKLNEEMMKLYREHGVNPLGGCFPLVMQAPVFIALYSVLRASTFFDAGLPAPVAAEVAFAKDTICRPAGTPAPSGPGKTVIRCTEGNDVQEFQIGRPVEQQKTSPTKEFDSLPPYVTLCNPRFEEEDKKEVIGFVCGSPPGTGHLPDDGELFRDIVRDRGTFLGMHLACTPMQSTNKTGMSQCTVRGDSAGPGIVGYFALVALMMGTTYYQQKQMSKQATGPQAKQMQTMGRIMPLLLGFFSLNMPAGVVVYWVVSNFWTIGQQYFFLSRQQPAGAGDQAAPSKGTPPAKPKPKPKPKR